MNRDSLLWHNMILRPGTKYRFITKTNQQQYPRQTTARLLSYEKRRREFVIDLRPKFGTSRIDLSTVLDIQPVPHDAEIVVGIRWKGPINDPLNRSASEQKGTDRGNQD